MSFKQHGADEERDRVKSETHPIPMYPLSPALMISTSK